MGDRILAGTLLLLAVLYGAVSRQWEIPFQYEPLGPRAFPIILAVLLGLSALRLLWRPDPDRHWPKPRVLQQQAAACGVMLLYAFSFQWLGFIIGTTLAGGFFARLFGMRLLRALATAAAMSILCFFACTRLLQLNVPTGTLFGG